MAVMQLYHHGATCGVPGNNRGMAGKRGAVQGWTHSATKNNVRFLRSVTLEDLSGTGLAFTLTLKDCPPSPDQWHRLRTNFIKRLQRLGMIRLHWVTEWQRRGVPHLHGVVYATAEMDSSQLANFYVSVRSAWLEVAAPYGAATHAQHLDWVSDSLGWMQYLAKHSARGVSHYQRSKESIPESWHSKTGRVWGHCGEWPTRDPIRIEFTEQSGFFAYRRLVKAWRIADARESGKLGRLLSAKRMLQGPRIHSELRGVSEWIPQDLSLRMLEFLAGAGHAIKC